MVLNHRGVAAVRMLAWCAGLALSGSAWGAPPNVRHVAVDAAPGGDGLSWATAYNDLQSAIMVVTSSGGAVNELWVKEGTYYPAPVGSSTRTATFSVGRYGLYGGFAGVETAREQRDPQAHVTVLNGDLGGLTKRVYHVVTMAGPDGVLSGVTVRGGRHDEFAQGNRGGGVLVLPAAQATIDRCLITDNHVYGMGFTGTPTPGRGAGIYSVGESLTLTDTVITGNLGGVLPGPFPDPRPLTDGGGLAAAGGGAVRAVGCTFSFNQASEGLFSPCMAGTTNGLRGGRGGGIYLDGVSARFENCIIDSNRAGDGGDRSGCSIGAGSGTAGGSGGGIYATSVSTVDLVNCVVTGNRAGSGGNGSTASPSFGGNGAAGGSGGGIFTTGTTLTMVNCLVADNSAGPGGAGTGGLSPGVGGEGGSGGGISAQPTVVMVNTTVAGNSYGSAGPGGTAGAAGMGAGIIAVGTATISNSILWNSEVSEYNLPAGAVVTYSDVRTGRAGTGNINADPQFTAGVGGGYHIGANSPCVDAASNLADGDPAEPGTQPLPAMDLDGSARRVDIAAVLDTGLGAAPIVDMGAYEAQNPCPADLTGDGLVDFGDYLEFLNLFDAGDLRVDYTGDGIVDFGDYLEFLNLYEEGC